jgi:hypothetical protein
MENKDGWVKTALSLALGTAAALVCWPPATTALGGAGEQAARHATGLCARASVARTPPRSTIAGRPATLVRRQGHVGGQRKYSAEEAPSGLRAQRQAFGAKTVDQFVEKAHAFVEHPPQGSLTLIAAQRRHLHLRSQVQHLRRGQQGGPRKAMFKPDDGMAYWQNRRT